MSRRSWLSSRAVRAALGALWGGSLLLVGGCAFIYGFDEYEVEPTGAGSGSMSGSGGGMATSSGMMSGGGGSGGAGGAPCMPAHECGIEELSVDMTDKSNGDISVSKNRVFWARDNALSYRDKAAGSKPVEALPFFTVRHVAAESDDSVYYGTIKDVGHYDVANDKQSDIAKDTTPTGVTVHMGSVYWPSADTNLYKSILGGSPTTSNTTGSAPSCISSSGGANQIYWTYHGPMPDVPTGGVKKIEDGDLVNVPAQNKPTGIAADGKDVYWITADGAIHQYIGASQTHKSAPPVLTGTVVTSGRIAVSASYVYWLGPDEATCTGACTCVDDKCGAVWRVSKTDINSLPEKFASKGYERLKGLAVETTATSSSDGIYVYWTTGGAQSKLLRKKD